MKLTTLSESEADEAALRIFAEGILGKQVDWHPGLRRRSGGFGSVLSVLPAQIRSLHYHTGADGLIVVLDSDFTPTHKPDHEPAYTDQKCRLCQLRRIVTDVSQYLRPRADGTSLKSAIGLAVPQIEAW
jgi:hypothetical protein